MDINGATAQPTVAPSPAFNPEDTVTLTGSKGTIKQVKRKDLAQYGLPSDYVSTADTQAKFIMDGNGDAAKADAATQLALNSRGYTNPNSAQGKNKAAIGDAKSLIQSTLQNYQNVPADQKGQIEGLKSKVPVLNGMIAPQATEYEAGLKGEAPALAKVFGGAGSGLRITQAEINSWAPFFPSVHKTDAQNQADVQKLDTIFKGRFKEGLDDTYLKEYGLSRDKSGKAVMASPGGMGVNNATGGKEQLNANLPENAMNDVVNMVKGVISLPHIAEQIAKTPDKSLPAMGQALLKELSQTTGITYANDKVNFDPGQALTHAYNHPVDTAAWLLPILKVGKAAAIAKLAGEGGKVAEGMDVANAAGKAGEAAQGMDVANAAGAAPNMLQRGMDKFATGTLDKTMGAGSKDYVLREATSGKPPLNQILLNDGVFKANDDAGRLKISGAARDQYGAQIGDTYKGSDRVFKDGQLGTLLDQKLGEKGWDQKSIDYIKNHLNTQGNFDLNSGDQLIPLHDAWLAARKMEQAPPKGLTSTETAIQAKNLSKDAARVVRDALAEKVPEVRPLNDQYSAHSDFINSLPDQTRPAIDLKNGVVSGAAAAIQQGAAPRVAQAVHDLQEPRKLLRDMRTKVGNIQFRK